MRATDFNRKHLGSYLFAGLLVVVSWLCLRPALNQPAADPVESNRSIKNVTPSSPKTFSELVALESSQLETCDIAAMNLLCAEGLPNAEGLELRTSLAVLDEWAGRIKSETERHFYRFQKHPAGFEHSEGFFRMLMMSVVLAEDFQIRYNPQRIATPGLAALEDGFFGDARDVLLHGLLAPRRMGTCSSMPVLYVALGRRLGYPLKLVTTKGHLFVRWDGPAERFNVDTTGQGLNRQDDEYYRHWPFPVTDSEIQEHGYLKSLNAAEELAVCLSIRGHCLEQAGRYAEAIHNYEHAARLRPASRDQQWLLAQAQSKIGHPSEPIASDSSVPAVGHVSGTVPLDDHQRLGSAPVADPNPLRQIR